MSKSRQGLAQAGVIGQATVYAATGAAVKVY